MPVRDCRLSDETEAGRTSTAADGPATHAAVAGDQRDAIGMTDDDPGAGIRDAPGAKRLVTDGGSDEAAVPGSVDGTGDATAEVDADVADDRTVVRITQGLLSYLLDRAETAEPESTSLVVGSTQAGEFDAELGLDPATPVLTHVYLPDAGQPVSAVFGVDLGTPAGRGRARFLSHPQGPLGVTRRDDLAAVVIVAVPPWDDGSFAAFDRSGRRLTLEPLDAEPPDEPFDHDLS